MESVLRGRYCSQGRRVTTECIVSCQRIGSVSIRRSADSALACESTMKAIVQTRYGSPDVLQLKDVDEPVAKDDEVLVRVHAAAVNIGDWHLLRGEPYAVRLVAGCGARGVRYRASISPDGSRRSAETSSSFDRAMRCSAGARAGSPSLRVLRREIFCPSRRTSRWNNRRRLETPRLLPLLPFAIKERYSRGTRC
jgi:hypothetical protein